MPPGSEIVAPPLGVSVRFGLARLASMEISYSVPTASVELSVPVRPAVPIWLTVSPESPNAKLADRDLGGRTVLPRYVTTEPAAETPTTAVSGAGPAWNKTLDAESSIF